MEATNFMKGGLIFLVLMITIAINLEDNMIARLGFQPTFLIITLVAVVITGLVMHRDLALVFLVLFLSVGANMPAGFMSNFGIDRDILTGILGAIVLVPLVAKIID
ncbi:MAG: hypothetical protein O6945_02085 [Gammaproteobacteria bacterium]|nr:hypothetical protein [Gammaproteobacteria bacterium]